MRLTALCMLAVVVPGCVVVVDGDGHRRNPPPREPEVQPPPVQQVTVTWEESRTVIIREYYECDVTYIGAWEHYRDELLWSDEDLLVLLFIARIARVDFHEVCMSYERNRYNLWRVVLAFRLTGGEFFLEIDKSARCTGVYERPYGCWRRQERFELSNDECHALVTLHIGVRYYGFTAVEWFQKTEKGRCHEVLVKEGSRCGKGRQTYRQSTVVEITKPWSSREERERCDRDRYDAKITFGREYDDRVREGRPCPTVRRDDDDAKREAERRRKDAEEARKRQDDDARRRREAREGEARTKWTAAVACYEKSEWSKAREMFEELVLKYDDTSYMTELLRSGTSRASTAHGYSTECERNLARDENAADAKRCRDAEEARRREAEEIRKREEEARRRADEEARRRADEERKRDEQRKADEERKNRDGADRERKCREGMDRGRGKQDKGDYDGAIAEFTAVLKIDATFGLALGHRGWCRAQKGDHDGAIADCEAAIKIDVTIYIAFAGRAAARCAKGDYDGGITDFKKCLDKAPSDWKEKKIVEKACKDAEAEHDKKLKAMNDAERKKLEDERRKREEADRKAEEEARKKAVDEAKRKANEEARKKAAEEARKKAEEERKADEAKRKAEDEARKKADEDRKKREDEARRAEDEARKKADLERKDREKACRDGLERGQQKEDKGDYDGAIAEFTAVLKIDAKFTLAIAHRGWCHEKKGDHDRAIVDCDAAIKIDATLHIALAARGSARCAKGDLDGGIADYEAALKQAPGSWKERKAIDKACKDAQAKKTGPSDEAKRKADEAKRKADEEAKRKADDEAKRKADEEAKRKADEEAKRKGDDEAKRKADEAKRKADEEAKRKADDEAKRKAADEAKRKADEEAKRKAADEAKRKADEEAKRKADDEAKRKADDEAKRKAADEAKRKADEEAKNKGNAENITKCRATIDRLAAALDAYRQYHQGKGKKDQLPDGDNAAMVKILTVKPNDLKDPFIKFGDKECDKDGRVLDSWGNPLIYKNHVKNWPKNKDDKNVHNKQGADVYSCGPNGKDEGGEGDDIGNWKK